MKKRTKHVQQIKKRTRTENKKPTTTNKITKSMTRIRKQLKQINREKQVKIIKQVKRRLRHRENQE